MSVRKDISEYVDTLTLSECLKWLETLSTMEYWVSGGEHEKEIIESRSDIPIRELLTTCVYGWAYQRSLDDYKVFMKEVLGDTVPQSAILQAFEQDFPALWCLDKEKVLNVHNWCV